MPQTATFLSRIYGIRAKGIEIINVKALGFSFVCLAK
jgi:hypothetical protein